MNRGLLAFDLCVDQAIANGAPDRDIAHHIVVAAYAATPDDPNPLRFFQSLLDEVTRRAQDQTRMAGK